MSAQKKTLHTKSDAGNELRFELHGPDRPWGAPYFCLYINGEFAGSAHGNEARREWRRAVAAVTT